ncbi:hypothetical protein E1193_05090 [Micromonospora sp. KC606]|uniref:hypothetical protein n=1 Tax=Micromonospora sp. KC606 TaxID=2530379 RepID=UPI001046161F|nr:hypothetical protein [Micromonospora sp. KC606]TDC84698.1 hypothetical protein E1193_05090 [Micromonospora sp. KC606]
MSTALIRCAVRLRPEQTAWGTERGHPTVTVSSAVVYDMGDVIVSVAQGRAGVMALTLTVLQRLSARVTHGVTDMAYP